MTPLDPQRIYDALEGLQSDVRDILVHQKEQNGNVTHNARCIEANTRLLEKHGEILIDHGERLGRLEKGEEVEADWQREFREDAKGELDWSREQILKLLFQILPWVGLLGLVAERLLN